MKIDEKFNSISHFLGAVFSLIGGIFLIKYAYSTGDTWKISGSIIYIITLLTVLSASTVYHGVSGSKKKIFQILDRISIFYLIAGTYTPFLFVIDHPLRWAVLGWVWGLAVFGTVFILVFKEKYDLLATLLYLFAGWTIMVDIKGFYTIFPMEGFYWVVSGGILYTIGAVFYSLDNKLKYNHEIWHIFVLLASFCFFISVYNYVIPYTALTAVK
ncbi:MAG TPA: hemolysin III family protein [Leptospiraceae bacterium]|nr:hemolysin III family protein [Leptospiraceae bacterium]HMZ57176.1 hemolysin III family protein [Leptospiraceae bacterium]HNF14791.1 hemolysin III family protein [Leptospiraceae bacterium]HNH11212.1 hemolysin III family protein [Leptospiraceae bacterium]HNN02696.1 hemolysin III family protein [Leptospiraceae bacterium]